MNRQKTILLLLALVLFFWTQAWSVETGEIKGKVIEEKGEGLPGVEITAQSPRLQGKRTVLSSKTGDFHFPILPVGNYTLTFNIEGFNPVIQENVIVRLGQVTNLKVTMALSAIRKEIVVTAELPLIDKTSTNTSFHLTTTELETIPSQYRTVVDAVKITPGVTGVRVNTRRGTATQGLPSFRGEGEEGTNWIVDGLSISGVRLRNAGMHLNYDSLDEIQIISDPFSPEFGSAYGGIVNMVTKSGSNKFRGETSFIFTDKSLQAPRMDQLSVVSEPDSFSNANWYLNLGGPFNVNSNHNFSMTSIYHTSLRQSGGIGIQELYETNDFADLILRLNYKGILNSSTFIEAGLGHVRRNSFTEPADQHLGPAQYYIEDLARGINNSYGNITDNQKRLDFNIKLTKFIETETFGHHELSFGFEYYSFSSKFAVDFTGIDEDIYPANGFDNGTKYYFDTWAGGQGTPTFFYEYGDFDFINSAQGIGIFFKDKMTWGRFTFMAGIRSQTQHCQDHNGDTLWYWNLRDFLSPRFSLAVDITGNGVNIFKLGWGRFSDLITTMPLGLLNSGAGLKFRTYRWQGPPIPTETEQHNPVNWLFENEQGAQAFEIDETLEPNFLTRYLIEFDRKLGRDWAFKARYVRTKSEKLLEVLAIFDLVTAYKFLYDNFEYKRRNYEGVLNSNSTERSVRTFICTHPTAIPPQKGRTPVKPKQAPGTKKKEAPTTSDFSETISTFPTFPDMRMKKRIGIGP
ncbi:hypothetical protein ES703_37308 [subsurface metagenome]